MAVLKKIKGSTLMETLVATVLIVIVFMVSSMILNNVFSNSVNSDKRAIDTRLNELMYLTSHHRLQVPYREDLKPWSIDITLDAGKKRYQLTAINQSNNQTMKRYIYGN